MKVDSKLQQVDDALASGDVGVVKTSLAELRAAIDQHIGETELLETVEKSYGELLNGKDHIQEVASRILTPMAFFTAATTALFARSASSGLPTDETQRIVFAAYMIFLLLGSTFLLGTLWPPEWEKREKDSPRRLHAFTNLENIARYDSVETLNAALKEQSKELAEFRTELIHAYLRERDGLVDYSKMAYRHLRVGIRALIVAFFFFVWLVGEMVLAGTMWEKGVGVSISVLAFAMAWGAFIRANYRLNAPMVGWLLLTAVLLGVTFW
jgi:hypothetical protein